MRRRPAIAAWNSARSVSCRRIPPILGPALAERDLSLIGGVVFRPFHDAAKWDEVMDASLRTCRALAAHGATRLVLIDSISPVARRPPAGPTKRSGWTRRTSQNFSTGCVPSPRSANDEFGLDHDPPCARRRLRGIRGRARTGSRCHRSAAAGLCLDTGHSIYAGFDPVAFYEASRRPGHLSSFQRRRSSHSQPCDRKPHGLLRRLRARAVLQSWQGRGRFCRRAAGAGRPRLFAAGATVEQDCDPHGATSPLDDAKANLDYLKTVGLA